MLRAKALSTCLLLLGGCDLIDQATSTIVVGGLVLATPELKLATFYDVPSEVAASVWVGERESATSDEAPKPLSGLDVTVTANGSAVKLPEQQGQPGVYATASPETPALVYTPGATYVFDARVEEAHGGEAVAPPRISANDITLSPALGASAIPMVGTHPKNAALTVGWSKAFGRFGLLTVFRADKSNPTRPQLVFDNRPKTASDVLNLVIGTPPTEYTIPADTFAQDGLYALTLVAAERGDIRDNTSIASPLLVGSGAVVFFAVGNP